MTVTAREAREIRVAHFGQAENGARVTTATRINNDLSIGIDLGSTGSLPLLANRGLASPGFQPDSGGFFIDQADASRLVSMVPESAHLIRQYLIGRDVMQRPQPRWALDFALMTEQEARQHAVLFDIVATRVMPEKAVKKDDAARARWWQYSRSRADLRNALVGLHSYLVTTRTAKHRVFSALPVQIAPDNTLVCFPVEDFAILGFLSSRVHRVWSDAVGGRLGVGNDQRYDKARCFDPFPFPDPSSALRDSIGALAEKLDQHRKDAIARDERVTMTGMYNVVEKLRSGEALTPKERAIHEVAACGILRDMHDELDALVAEAYGWPWPMEKEEILERLVALHDERVAEEKRGVIRWLRPEYQIPRFAPGHVAELELPAAEAVEEVAPAALVAWPATAVEQLAALQALVGRAPLTLEEAVAAFTGGDRKLVGRHLETLSMLGEVREVAGRFGG